MKTDNLFEEVSETQIEEVNGGAFPAGLAAYYIVKGIADLAVIAGSIWLANKAGEKIGEAIDDITTN